MIGGPIGEGRSGIVRLKRRNRLLSRSFFNATQAPKWRPQQVGHREAQVASRNASLRRDGGARGPDWRAAGQASRPSSRSSLGDVDASLREAFLRASHARARMEQEADREPDADRRATWRLQRMGVPRQRTTDVSNPESSRIRGKGADRSYAFKRFDGCSSALIDNRALALSTVNLSASCEIGG